MKTPFWLLSWLLVAAVSIQSGCAPAGAGALIDNGGAAVESPNDSDANPTPPGEGTDLATPPDDEVDTATPPDNGADDPSMPDDVPPTDAGGASSVVLMGEFDTQTGLQLNAGGFTADFPASALETNTEITVELSPFMNLPGGLPGGVSFTGALFEPTGVELSEPAQITTTLLTPTLASVLPLVTFDLQRKAWISGGGTAAVDSNGVGVSFEVDFLGLVGVPDGVAQPPAGEPIGNLLTVTNSGQFTSNVIQAEDASLFFSRAVEGSLNVNVMTQNTDSHGEFTMQTLSLSAIGITYSGNIVIAEVGGSDSFYNTGDFRNPDEPAVGVMMLSTDGTVATLTVYVATPERVIAGTLTGPTS